MARTPAKKSVAKKPAAKPKKSVASASRKSTPSKRRGPMDAAVVAKYTEAINKALGEATFEKLFAVIKDDVQVTQAEAIGIASAILEAPVTPSTARGAALARILKLHNSVATFKLKQRAVGGRSAA